MQDAPFLPAPPLGAAVVQLLAERRAAPAEPVACLVAGPAGVARALGKAGHGVTRWRLTAGAASPAGQAEAAEPLQHEGPLEAPPAGMERFGAVVLVGALTGQAEPVAALSGLVGRCRPGAWVVVVEPAAFGRGGRWLGRLLGRLRGRPIVTDASTLAALCLSSGLTELRQRWPQGLRSLVMTAGRVHPLAGAGAP